MKTPSQRKKPARKLASDEIKAGAGSRARFESVVSNLMQIDKDEVDAIMEAEKRPYTGKKRGRKPKA